MRLFIGTALVLALTGCGPTTDFNGYTSLTGELTFTSITTNGEVVCDVDLRLIGTPYTAPCSDCEFAFHVDPEVVEDRGTDDCVLSSIWTYVDDDFIGNSGLGYSEATVDLDGQPMDRALVGVGDLDNRRAASAGVISDDDPRSTVDWNGTDTLTWSHSFDEAYGDDLVFRYDECPWDDVDELSGRRPDEDYTATGEVDCAGFTVDIYTFEGRAGETLSLGLDTVAADSAFDSILFVAGEDGCVQALGDDVFSCTYAPLDFSCGGGKFTPEADGTYQLYAQSLDACTSPDNDGDGFGDVAGYRLSIEADYDPKLTQTGDNVPRTEELIVSSVEGLVTVSKEAK